MKDTQPDPTTDMQSVLDNMQQAQLRDGPASLALRKDRLTRAAALLRDNEQRICAALSADFGHRSTQSSMFTDVALPIKELNHVRKHLKSWMKPRRRRLEFPLGLTGASGKVEYQPKGVIGIMAPWNFPVYLVFGPLAGVLGAGNRAMIKPSEFTPETSALMAELITESFDADEVQVINGDAKVAADFSALPFDHMVFTGSTGVGRHVMRAAADNLVPVTLELGGKSPAIVGKSADLDKATTSIMHGKVLNAGQICVSPDYVLLPEENRDAFISGARDAVKAMFPTGLKDNDDYTSILNAAHLDRLNGYLDDARSKGAEIIELNPLAEDFTQQPHRKMPPTLIFNVTDDMTVMREEIFGPLLPVKLTKSTAEAVDHVNANPRPLSLYFFGNSRQEEAQVLNNTTAGGVTVNDTLLHLAQENLPFGGIGPSGMGHYHGHEGFLQFSHQKAVFRQMRFDLLKFIRPPYGKLFRAYAKYMSRR